MDWVIKSYVGRATKELVIEEFLRVLCLDWVAISYFGQATKEVIIEEFLNVAWLVLGIIP